MTITATSYSKYQVNDSNKITEDDEFTVTYLSPCGDTSFTTVTPTTQNQPAANSYDGTDIVYTYVDFTVDPDICPLTLSCIDVVNPALNTAPLACPDPMTNTIT